MILFKKLQILPLASQYLLSLLMSVVQNKHFFSSNIENHNIDTRRRNNLYLPQANLTIYQKRAYYSGIKIFNNLHLEIKNVAGNLKKFKIALKQFLYTYLFYTLEEYSNQTRIMYCITKFLIILVLVLSFCQRTLYTYSMIVHYVLIRFHCINLIFMYHIYKIISLGILLSGLILYCAYCYANDKFYIHFDGSLECLINIQINFHKQLLSN